jgi:hypothetical protein
MLVSEFFHFKSVILVKYSTPGRDFPSKSSREAPPPVETWLIFSADPLTELTRLTVSPPPTIEIDPFLV